MSSEDQLKRSAGRVDESLEAGSASIRGKLSLEAATHLLIAEARKLLDDTAEIAEGYKPTKR